MTTHSEMDSKTGKVDFASVDDKLDSGAIIVPTLGDMRPRSEFGIWQTVRSQRWTVGYVLLACCGALSEGYQLVLPPVLMSNPGFVNEMGIDGLGAGKSRALEPIHLVAWSSAYNASYIISLMSAWWFVERFGNKNTLYASQAVLAVACTVEVLSKDWTSWLASNICYGIAVGLTQCAAVNYVTDISPTRIRGALLCCYPLLHAVGQFCGTIAVQVMIVTSPLHYRRVLYAQYLFICIAIAGLGFMPESPRWLITRGKEIPARFSMQRLRAGSGESETANEVDTLINEVGDKTGLTGWSHAIRGTNMRRVLSSSFCLIWQRWLGSSVVLGYATYFFQLAGVVDPFTASIVVCLILVLGLTTSTYLVERVGRRRLLLYAGPAMICLLLLIGGVLSLPFTSATGIGLVSIGCLWIALHSFSVAPLAFVYLGENSSSHLRPKTISIAASGAALVNLIVDYAIPLALNNHHFKLSYAAWLFTCTGIIGLVLCYLYIPETANCSTLHLDMQFECRIPARRFMVDISHQQLPNDSSSEREAEFGDVNQVDLESPK